MLTKCIRKEYLCIKEWRQRQGINHRIDYWRFDWIPGWPWRCWWSRCRPPDRRRCDCVWGRGATASISTRRPARCGRCRSPPGCPCRRWRYKCRRLFRQRFYSSAKIKSKIKSFIANWRANSIESITIIKKLLIILFEIHIFI